MPVTQKVLMDKAWQDLDPLRPVSAEDPDDWYQDLAQVRGIGSFTEVIARQIKRQAERPQRELVLGHRGCGKSTELGRLQRLLQQDGFRCVRAEVDRELDKEDVDIVEVQVLLLERIGALLLDLDLPLDAELSRRVDDWFREEEETTEEKKSATVEASNDTGGLMQRVFGGLLPELKGNIRVSTEKRKVIRTKVKKRLPDFVKLVADVVGGANAVLQLGDFKGLVLLVDGLEKAGQVDSGERRVSAILLEQSEQWSQLPVPIVFSAPLELLSERTRVQNHYDHFYVMPAVPVEPRPDHDDDQAQQYAEVGRDLLRRLVARRVDVARLFVAQELLDQLIRSSGGSIRDLFRLIRDAIDFGPEGEPIGEAAVAWATKQQRLQLRMVLKKDDSTVFQSLLENPEGFYLTDQESGLLQRELVLAYCNGGLWYAPHPAVRPE